MKAIFLLILLNSASAFADEKISVFGDVVLYRCTAGACTQQPRSATNVQIVLKEGGRGISKGLHTFTKSFGGYDFSVDVEVYKLTNGEYFFRADLTHGKIGSGQLNFRRLGSVSVKSVNQLNQVYWQGEMANEELQVDFAFGAN